jgi:plasmid maintenance system antidote protein VapI
MNKELKAAIIRVYGTQFPFAHALNIRESTVSAVVRGHHQLTTEEKDRWAQMLFADVSVIFPEVPRG